MTSSSVSPSSSATLDAAPTTDISPPPVPTTTAVPSITTSPHATTASSHARTTTAPERGTTATSPPPASPTSASAAQDAGAAPLTVTDADRAAAVATVADMTVTDKAASVLMVTGQQAISTHLLRRYSFGGVILFAPGGVVDGTRNGTPTQVAAVTAGLRKDAAADSAGVPPLIATDQEYGLVQRLKHGFTAFPNAAALGAIKDISVASTLTRRIATAAAQEMLAVGVTVDFAPVFGVLPASGGPSSIGQYGRSYGADPARVAALVSAAVTGYQAGGVVASMKHFPGLARIAADSHVTLPALDVTCADWNAHEAIPAKAGIDAGAQMVMTGHMLLPAAGDRAVPASISPTIVEQLLGGDGAAGCVGMRFRGVTVTDSMQMAPITDHYASGPAAVKALAAGEDLILMPVNPANAVAGIVAAVKSGELPARRLDEAATAVLALRLASARVPRPPLSVVHSATHQALADAADAQPRS